MSTPHTRPHACDQPGSCTRRQSTPVTSPLASIRRLGRWWGSTWDLPVAGQYGDVDRDGFRVLQPRPGVEHDDPLARPYPAGPAEPPGSGHTRRALGTDPHALTGGERSDL